jgi:hypothetical protein
MTFWTGDNGAVGGGWMGDGRFDSRRRAEDGVWKMARRSGVGDRCGVGEGSSKEGEKEAEHEGDGEREGGGEGEGAGERRDMEGLESGRRGGEGDGSRDTSCFSFGGKRTSMRLSTRCCGNDVGSAGP